MVASKMRIKKVCEWCNKTFLAQKVSTRFCSHACSSRAYKHSKRRQRVEETERQVKLFVNEDPQINFQNREYLSVKEAAQYLGLTRDAIYKMIYSGRLRAFRVSSRLTYLKKQHIDFMLESTPYRKDAYKKEPEAITEFYTSKEVMDKYEISDAWLRKRADQKKIPRTTHRGKTLWSKKHIDAVFAQEEIDPSITEWYSTADIQEEFGMSLSAIYSFVLAQAIPRKKENNKTFYSKKHFDIARGVAEPEEPEYYTVVEAMEAYNMTRDQVYHYLKQYKINRIQVGRYTKFLKKDFDQIFEPPVIKQ